MNKESENIDIWRENWSSLVKETMRQTEYELHRELSIAEFARMIGLSPPALNKLLNGFTTPTASTVHLVAKFLNRSPESIWKEIYCTPEELQNQINQVSKSDLQKMLISLEPSEKAKMLSVLARQIEGLVSK